MTIRATFEPFTDRQKATITEAFARTDIYDYLAKLAKKLHRTQKEIIYQARELGVSAEYEQAKARYHKLHERLSRIGTSSLRGAPLERVDQGAIRKMTGDRLTLERQKRFRGPTW